VGLFWIDLLAWFPYDWVIGATFGCNENDVESLHTLRLVKLLRLFRLVRFLVHLGFS
jgi:hypothetical protein